MGVLAETPPEEDREPTAAKCGNAIEEQEEAAFGRRATVGAGKALPASRQVGGSTGGSAVDRRSRGKTRSSSSGVRRKSDLAATTEGIGRRPIGERNRLALATRSRAAAEEELVVTKEEGGAGLAGIKVLADSYFFEPYGMMQVWWLILIR